jgi:fermentation-respiration switch protein FrsA (DUF1100 family)
MRAEDARRWAEARRLVEERERQEAREQAAHVDPIGAALALIALAGRLQGWPPVDDPVSVREDELARDRWRRLRQRMRA